MITVESKCDKTTCHNCGKDATKRYGYGAIMEFRHTSVFDQPVILRIKPIRYQCEHCNSTTSERYDWVAEGGKITKGLEEHIMRCLINSTIQDVSRKEGISYSTIETALAYRAGDEISNRKGYFNCCSKRTDNPHVLAVLKDRKKETILDFLNTMLEHLKENGANILHRYV